jgi:DNA-binding XRE family transcriptional regulator
MTINSLFGPKNAEEELIFAEAAARVDLQTEIHELMLGKSMSKSDLARKLGVTRQTVQGFFRDDWNPSLRRVVTIFHALGELPRRST